MNKQFQELSIAYQVLSDPNLRHIYNVHGQKKGGGGVEPPGGFQDPDIVLGMMFGGDRFKDLVGEISIGALLVALRLRELGGYLRIELTLL